MKGSGRLFGIQQSLELGDLVAQHQSPLFEAAQGQFVDRLLQAGTVDQAVEIGVLDAQFDQ